MNNDLFAGTLNGLLVLRANSDTWSEVGAGLPADPWISSLGTSGDYILAGVRGDKIDAGISFQFNGFQLLSGHRTKKYPTE